MVIIMTAMIFRTLFFYFLILVLFRIMGKREVGELGITDLIVSVLIAEFVSISIENTDEPLIMTIIPMFIIVLLQIVFSYFSMKYFCKTLRFTSINFIFIFLK